MGLPPLAIAPQSGSGSLSLTVPNVPAVAGASIHAQALLVQGTLARFSNATRDVVLP